MEASQNNNNNNEGLSSLLNFPSSINDKENQILYENLKRYEEEKNEPLISPIIKQNLNNNEKPLINNNSNESNDNNILNKINIQQNNHNTISRNTNESPKTCSIINQKENTLTYTDIERSENKKLSLEKDEMLSTDLVLDEIKLKVDYDKIESELDKLRNNTHEEDNKGENENSNNQNNKNIQQTTINSNSQIEGDLFYYSEEEDEKIKQIRFNNEKIKQIQENLDKMEKNENENEIININKNMYSNTDIIYNYKIDNNINNSNMKNISKKIAVNNNINVNMEDNDIDLNKMLEKVEYGIDETGNPVSIKNYNEDNLKNNNNNINNDNINNKCDRKIIAYIIPSEEKGKNYLIDLKGQIIPKMKDDDFNYKYNNIRIIIKNFDVQNPKLRVFGARQRYSSIVSEEESNSQISKQENIPSGQNKHLILFKHIKDNIKSKNIEKFNFSKFSPIINKKNYYEQILNSNIENKKFYNHLVNKYSPISEKMNKNNIIYQKKPLIEYDKNDNNIFNNQNEKDNLVLRTSMILNRAEKESLLNNSNNDNNNTENIIYRINNSNLKNIILQRNESGLNTWRCHRTPSPIIKDYIPEPQKLKDDSARVNLYKIYRIQKEGDNKCDNYDKICNINIDNNNNPFLIRNDRHILKNSNSSVFSSKLIGNNFLFNNNMKQIIKNENSNNKKHPSLKKSLSSNNYNLSSTINSIANNIKKIECNIKNTLQKLMNKNEVINKNNNIIKSDTSTSCRSKHIIPYNSSPYFLNYNQNINNNTNILKYKLNNNTNIERKMNLRKIPLNKKYKISISPPKNNNFQCTVLSQEASNMIKDYANKSLTQRNAIKEPTTKIYITNTIRNTENNGKIINNKNKSNINKNISNGKVKKTKKKLNRSCNIEQNNEKDIIVPNKIKQTIKLNKNNKSNKNNKGNEKLNNKNKIKINENKPSSNKIEEKNKNTKNERKSNGSNGSNINGANKPYLDKLDKIIPIQNNLNINIYGQQKRIKSKNSALRIINTVIKQKKNKNFNKLMFSSESTSINSLKEVTFNGK